MEYVYLALALSLIALGLAGFALLRKPESVEYEPTGSDDITLFQGLQEQMDELRQSLSDSRPELQGRIEELGKLVAGLVDVPQAELDEDNESNPRGCTKTSHIWRKRPSLTNDHEHVYYCINNCGSSLRHRFE